MLTVLGLGRLVDDVTLKTVKVGEADKVVGEFEVACKIKQGSFTSFVKIEVWNEQAEACGKYLRRGSKVAFSGEVMVRSYKRENGSRGTEIKLISPFVEFVEMHKENDSEEGND